MLTRFESHPESDPLIESKMLMRNITTIQKQVEGRNFDIRKHVLEYDDVLNHHRLAIYSRRRKIVDGADIHADVVEMIRSEVDRTIRHAVGDEKIYDSIDTIVDSVNDFADQGVVTRELYQGADTIEECIDRTLTLLLETVE